NYTIAISCKDQNGTGSVVASGTNAGPLNVPVAAGDDIVCTITNTRKTGKLEVQKVLSPAADPGTFNLQIDGSTAGTGGGVGDGGTTGEQTVNTGTRTVGETAASGSLTNYTIAISCKDQNGTGSVVASGTNAGPLNVPVAAGDDIVCTITNTRKTGTITVTKHLSPNTDPGKFNLK